jgi:hypothetical protein
MISAFYGRGQAYEKALGQGDDVLSVVLGRNLYGAAPVDAEILQSMTRYVRRTIAALESQSLAAIVAGHVEFAVP